MTQLTPAGLIKILGHVTLVLVIPIIGGVVAGLVLDAVLHTSPLLVLGGLAVGSVVAAIGIGWYIRVNAPGAGSHDDGPRAT